MRQHRDEHRRHAVERGTALCRNRAQSRLRIEARRRIDHRRTVGQAGEIAHHHAEAMIERHGNADAVSRAQTHAATDEIAVVEDVAMAERRALGQPGGTAGELDIDRIARIEIARQCARRMRRDIGEGQPARPLVPADQDARAQRRQPRSAQRLDHLGIGAGLEALGRDQRGETDLVDRVFDLGQAVGRVDRHQDQPRARRRELGQRPFGAIGRPDADPLPGLQTQRQQPGRERVGPREQFGEAPANILRDRDERVALPPYRRRAYQRLTDRMFDQRRRIGAADMAEAGGDEAHLPGTSQEKLAASSVEPLPSQRATLGQAQSGRVRCALAGKPR
eukprot:Opistho-2@33913